VSGVGFVVEAREGLDLGERVFADFFLGFGIGDLHSVDRGVVPHHRNPTSANKPAGHDPRLLIVWNWSYYRSNHQRMPVISG
jgi:hypothetical protein